MARIGYLITLLGVLGMLGGCPGCECRNSKPCHGDYLIGEPLPDPTLNDSRLALDMAERCETMVGDLEADDQDWIERIDLPCLEYVYKDDVSVHVHIRNNDALTSIDMRRLVSVDGTLYISSNDLLTDLDMSSLTYLEASLSVNDNELLTDLDVSSLAVLEKSLSVYENDSLSSLDGLSNLKSVGSSLRIANNPCLSQDEAEAFAASLDVGYTITVEDNGADYPCE